MTTIADISVLRTWKLLGGPDPRKAGAKLRSVAWWRGGRSLNVEINTQTNCWRDYRDGIGGDVLDLVVVVRHCTKADGFRWLRDVGLLPPDEETPEQRREREREQRERLLDLRDAQWFAAAALITAEAALEQMETEDDQRAPLTGLILALRGGEAATLAEYRQWREHHPTLTAALVKAGREHDRRVQVRLADWIARHG